MTAMVPPRRSIRNLRPQRVGTTSPTEPKTAPGADPPAHVAMANLELLFAVVVRRRIAQVGAAVDGESITNHPRSSIDRDLRPRLRSRHFPVEPVCDRAGRGGSALFRR